MNTNIYIVLNILILTTVIEKCLASNRNNKITDQYEAKQYLKYVNKQLALNSRRMALAKWRYSVDINKETSKQKQTLSKELNEFFKQIYIKTHAFDWSGFDEKTQRQFDGIATIGTAALTGKDETEFLKISDEMQTIYSSGKVCVGGKCGLELEPDLSRIFDNSRNYSELLEAWTAWREATGAQVRDRYIRYIALSNKAAKMNSKPNKTPYKTMDELELEGWETDDMKGMAMNLMNELMPFYRKLHAYVRLKLKKAFPSKMPNDNTIPAHLLGNMWAQTWTTVKDVLPFPDLPPIDVTKALVKQKYSSHRMFKLAEKFFVDLGLEPMTPTFWKKSVIDKPTDGRVMVCHPSAWDFSTDYDFRIKQCTEPTMEFLLTIHHEMGHIQYYMLYRDQPKLFRDGANPGFHEAIGDLMALSVSTPKHLKQIGLLDWDESLDMEKLNLNFQMRMALDKLTVIFWAYVVDRWRWDAFSGAVTTDAMNRHWWHLRGQYQGISPPVNRSENDFDPGAKYHVVANVPYIRYFVSHILQFQFHKSLCAFTQKDVPLHECDIDGDREAGNKLRNVLSLGASEKWQKQLKLLTGSEKMDVKPMLEYFKPLQDFLDKELAKTTVGWNFNVDNYFDSNREIETKNDKTLRNFNSLDDEEIPVIAMNDNIRHKI